MKQSRTPKTPISMWIDEARKALIEEGIGGVKVDRLATRLGVTRGGFYHNFEDRNALLAELLTRWKRDCRFFPALSNDLTPGEAVAWMERAVTRMIEEDGFDSRFDMAVREWARSDERTAAAVKASDDERLATLRRFFELLGHGSEEATIRANTFYFHQIGYYAIGVKSSISERMKNAGTYLKILCGQRALEAARKEVQSSSSRPRVSIVA
ncbi:TetR/AcrR family transcriptional regulator [Sphingorhabdus sp.]|uniref:TetR/AcrR family transcriptional regulator n=1 Tax=Sphingorhabdus sp. TaxID=1902408 RepID=UPI0037C5155D